MLLVPVFALLLLGGSPTFAAPPAEEKCMAPAEYVQFDIALPNARGSIVSAEECDSLLFGDFTPGYDIMKYWIDPGSSVSTMKCCCMTNFIWRIQAIAVSAADWRTCWRPDPIK
jgi:hypothetical protein